MIPHYVKDRLDAIRNGTLDLDAEQEQAWDELEEAEKKRYNDSYAMYRSHLENGHEHHHHDHKHGDSHSHGKEESTSTPAASKADDDVEMADETAGSEAGFHAVNRA